MAAIGTLFTFTANTIIRSAQVNSNFSDIKTAYNAHDTATTGVHGITSPNAIVGTTSSQELTNKTIGVTNQINYLTSAKNADYVITDTDKIRTVLVTAAANRTITLPTLADNQGRIIEVKKVDSGTGEVIVDGEGAETIDGAITINLSEQYDSITLIAGASEWNVLEYPRIRIQDFTTVESPGTASQIQAGHEWTYTDLDSNLSNFTTLASYRFVDSGSLIDDDTGTYDLTNNNAATAADGILGSGHATALDGTNQTYTNGTLIDTMPTNLAICFWFKADDGQPAAAEYLFCKEGATGTGQNRLAMYIGTDGVMELELRNQNNNKDQILSTVLPDGATDWHFVCLNWDTTNGIRVWFDGLEEASFSSSTTLPTGGATSDFIIGDFSAAGSYFDGTIGHFIVADAVLNQDDVEYMYASTIPIPASLQGKSFNVIEQVKPQGDATYTRYQEFQEIARSATTIYAQGRQWGSTDSVKLEGMVS